MATGEAPADVVAAGELPEILKSAKGAVTLPLHIRRCYVYAPIIKKS